MKTKIVASLIEGEQYEIANNAARAPYFIVFQDDVYVKSIKNPFTVGGGAGFAVADLLHDEGCDIFVAKNIGGNMKGKLGEYNIAIQLS